MLKSNFFIAHSYNKSNYQIIVLFVNWQIERACAENLGKKRERQKLN